MDYKQGELGFDNYEGRYIIMFDEPGLFNRSLHPGDVLEVLVGRDWLPVRIEYYNGWYFIESSIRIKDGLIVRIK